MRLGKLINVTILLAAFLLPFIAFADDRTEANKLFVQAARFVRQAENADDPGMTQELYNKALGLLEDIEIRYPGTDLAVKIVSYQKIGSVSRGDIENKLANPRHSQEAKVSQPSTPSNQPQPTMTPQIASSAPVATPPQLHKLSKPLVDLSRRAWFVRLGVGYSNPEDISLKLDNEDTAGEASLSENLGFELTVGRNVGASFKFEFELARRNFDAKTIKGRERGVFRGASDSSGDVDFYTAMNNGLYELPLGWRYKPYIGGGIGAAYAKLNNIRALAKIHKALWGGYFLAHYHGRSRIGRPCYSNEV